MEAANTTSLIPLHTNQVTKRHGEITSNLKIITAVMRFPHREMRLMTMESRLSLERLALLVSLRTRPSTGVIISFPPELLSHLWPLRAVVLKRDGALAKVYYLDYGNSESLSLGSIFTMPPNQLATQMLSIRCRWCPRRWWWWLIWCWWHADDVRYRD